MHTAGPSREPSTPSPPLQRGKACISCRRRKMRCDGARPICTQCIRGDRADDCEYTDGNKRPRMLVLEEDIARLQSRLQELENPNNLTPSVELYSPYPVQNAYPRATTQQVLQTSESASSSSTSSTATSSGESARILSPHYNLHRSISVVVPQAAECGFFLNAERLSAAGTNVIPALHSTMALWAVHLSPPESSEHGFLTEPSLLARALHQLSDALSESSSASNPQFFMQVLQTEALLAFYLQRTGHILGARYHASASFSIAVGLHLHTRQSHSSPASLFSFVGSYYPQLPPPVDVAEERERVDAFWTVYSLDRCLAVINNASPTINNAITITAPWPGTIQANDMETSSVHPMSSGMLGDTVKQFLTGHAWNLELESALSLQARASVLLSEAASIAALFTTEPSVSLSADFRNRLTMLDNLIQQFSTSLPIPASIVSTQPGDVRQVLLTITLSALAHITLHRPFASSHGPSNRRCIDSVLRVVRALDGTSTQENLNPICVTIWIALCFVLHEELLRLRDERFQSTASSSSHVTLYTVHQEEAEILHALKRLLAVLSDVDSTSPSTTLNAKFESLMPIFQSIESL